MRWNRPPINAAFLLRAALYTVVCTWAIYAWTVRWLLPDAVAGN